MEPLRITVRNVNGALARAVRLLASETPVVVAPRGEATCEWPTPVLTTYLRPQERVLFLAERRANPFFHFFEALWMLEGRSDVDFVARFVKRMAFFSDDGRTLRGAYGERWRQAYGFDQLWAVVELLRREPETRRAVLTIWFPAVDLGSTSKDVPCNTHAYFKLRDGELRMTVMCRSNDVLWGAYGANAVHFSMLQEYVAGQVGARVGPLYQLSDSWHVYTSGEAGALWDRLRTAGARLLDDRYEALGVKPFPLMADAAWDADRRQFFQAWDDGAASVDPAWFHHAWWKRVAAPMYRAYATRDARELALCVADDWRAAGFDWLAQRGSP